MDLLSRLFRRQAVVDQTQDVACAPVEQPAQFRFRDLHARIDGATDPAEGLQLMAQADELESVLVDRNLKGKGLERQGCEAEAIALYEANVADCFDGSHPYERLLIIYMREGAQVHAERVARACLAHCASGMSEKLKVRCRKVLALGGESG